MLPARRPDSVVNAGIRWPILGKRKYMWITAVHVQLPDPRNIVLQRASRHRYTNFLGVWRKSGIARHHMLGVPDFLYVLAVSVTYINRFLFIERYQLPIRAITGAARRDISEPLGRTSQHGHGPYCSPLCFVVQIALQQQKLRAVRRNIQDIHVADRGTQRRHSSALYGHFDGMPVADEINTRSVRKDRASFSFARKCELLHWQWRIGRGRAVAAQRNPCCGAGQHYRGPNPDPLSRFHTLWQLYRQPALRSFRLLFHQPPQIHHQLMRRLITVFAILL